MDTATSRSVVTFSTGDNGHTHCKRLRFVRLMKQPPAPSRPDMNTGSKNRSNTVRTQNLQECCYILLVLIYVKNVLLFLSVRLLY